MFSIVFDGRIAVASVFDAIPENWRVIDCRPLIDGPGNSDELVQSILDLGIASLNESKKVCFACDYGHSRSNLLAALAISKISRVAIEDAVMSLKGFHPESEIKIGILKRYLSSADIKWSKCFAITGATGLIGRNLSIALRRKGSKVMALSRFQHGDYLEDSATIKCIIEKNEITDIIHLAYPQPRNSYQSTRKSFGQLINLLDGCTSTSCKLHYISGWIVFDGLSEGYVDEETLPKPHSIYAQAKALQEQLVTLHGKNNDLLYRIYRLPGIYSKETLEPRFLRYIADCVVAGVDIIVHDFVNGPAVVPLASLEKTITSLANQLVAPGRSETDIVHLNEQCCNLSIKTIAEKVAEKYKLRVAFTPISRAVFNGIFASKILPSGNGDLGVNQSEIDLANFIEELISAKQSETTGC